MLDFILLVSDEGLQEDHLLLESGVVNRLSHLQGLVEVPIFVVALSQIELVVSDFWVELRELFVDSSGVEEILAHVIAVGEKGHGSASGTEL